MKNLLGLYEKALPHEMGWLEKLQMAQKLGFDFMEISIDESDERLARLTWTTAEKQQLCEAMRTTGIPLLSMCFSGHRRFPLGSRQMDIRAKALSMMSQAIDLARDLGIRVIQLAGYDVYYEAAGEDTRAYFLEGLKQSVAMAARSQVMLAIEIMDTPFLNSITKYLYYDEQIKSSWLTVYPDIGNLSAWGNDVAAELELGFSRIVAVHIKETRNVTATFQGAFRDVPFGEGNVDFVHIFKKLKKLGYSGPFVMEMWGDTFPDSIQEITRSKKFIMNKLCEGGF
ncbi:hexulose-6-phosphate isomerase [Sporomusaceae bacterium BoRhaA]|uniref:L-ribulose-5-phosphate 3-epimerase n=1 Tax=Pelorhabdus rhamnosifermentans TaxID=2772457 RepID=UPI0028A66808|nr:L-ribulose-5-phosphate 3-epimerase [Pelorhabdus rhamnosifermentans]MBU2700882.1 hexulose-6-phosphate isomerase [Pelorhabdus rhamnosifermentans]